MPSQLCRSVNPNANAEGIEPKSKVKPTVMTIENKAKPAAKPTATPAKSNSKDANDGRPRKIQPDQQ